jgi:hypothetical protein
MMKSYTRKQFALTGIAIMVCFSPTLIAKDRERVGNSFIHVKTNADER